MNDYIKREDALASIETKMAGKQNRLKAIIAINEVPAADVRENVCGRWTHKQNCEGEWICSLCNADLAFVYGLESGLPNFCPNCGADMRGDRYEPR